MFCHAPTRTIPNEIDLPQVQQLVSLVYTLAEVVLERSVREILMREGVAPITAKVRKRKKESFFFNLQNYLVE